LRIEGTPIVESSFWWTVLGPVRGRRAGREARLGSPQRRALMALLLAAGGRPVTMAEITGALWRGDPPELAANVVQGHVGAIRRMLEPDARRLLAELAAKHLVDEYRPGRYSWHGLVGDYGVELATSLLPAAERDRVRRRLFDHYLFNNRQVTAIAWMKLAAVPPEQRVRPACPGYQAEQRMLRSLLTLALAEGYGEYVWRFAGVIGDYLDRSGAWPDLRAAGAAALVAAERCGDTARTAQALRGLARVHAGLRDYPTAIDLMTAAMPLFVQLDDRRSLAGLHLGSAWLGAKAGRPAAGALHADRMLAITRREAAPAEVASALNAVGWFEAKQSRHEAAVGHCREALRILAGLGMRRAQADTWDTLGFVDRRLGRPREALVSYQRALALHREFGARAAEAAILRRIAVVARAAHDVPTARSALDEAAEIRRELGDPAAELDGAVR
jgi:tetratricopeptide (TPR) repeat protein